MAFVKGRPGEYISTLVGEQAGWSPEERAAFEANQRTRSPAGEAIGGETYVADRATVGSGNRPHTVSNASIASSEAARQAQQSADQARYGRAASGDGIVANRYVDPFNVNRNDYAYGGTTQAQYGVMADAAAGRAAPQANMAQSDASRAMMADAAGQYAAMARGEGPNLAATQLRAGLDQSIAAQMAMANSQRGGALARAGAMRQASLAGDQQRVAMANQAAQLAQQQQLAGMHGYAGLGGQIRAGDMSAAGMNLNAQLAGQAQNDALRMGMLGYGHQASMADMAGRGEGANQARSAFETAQNTNAAMTQGRMAQDQAFADRMFGAGASAAGGAAGWLWNSARGGK